LFGAEQISVQQVQRGTSPRDDALLSWPGPTRRWSSKWLGRLLRCRAGCGCRTGNGA